MSNFILTIPQVQAAEELSNELGKILPEPLMSRLLDVHFELFERLKLQLEITEFLTSKLIADSDGI